MRNTKLLLKDILHLRGKYEIDAFYFIDDLFTLNKKYVLEFCSELQKSKTNLLWGCSSRVTTLDEEMVEGMRNAGCIQMDFGVERGSDESLKRLKKGQTIKQIQEAFDLCKRYNIRTFANMLVNIPEERSEDFCHQEKLLQKIKPTVTSVNIFRGYYGVELTDQVPTQEVLSFARTTTRRYNSVWRNLRFHLTFRYLKCLFYSRRKLNYLKQLWRLLNEIFNQTLG